MGDADLAVGEFDLVAGLMDPFDGEDDGEEPEGEGEGGPEEAGFRDPFGALEMCGRGRHRGRL